MQRERYEFNTIFDYGPSAGVIIPKYNVVVGGARYSAGMPITRGTVFSGLNLFNYIGRPLQGIWDPANQILTIEGFF